LSPKFIGIKLEPNLRAVVKIRDGTSAFGIITRLVVFRNTKMLIWAEK
jgi:hypothetical protein